MKLNKLYVFGCVFSFLLFSCSTDEVLLPQESLGQYTNGMLVLNEGNYGTDNSEIAFISNDFSTIQNNVFHTVNSNLTLGDTSQSIAFYNDLAFIVVNNSQKIEVVNRYTMAHVATITSGLSNPRYIAFINGKGYVTNWGDGSSTTDDYVTEVNLNTYSVSSTISVAEGPEKIVTYNNKLYVAHKGGYGQGNTVSIINLSNNNIASLPVGDVPVSLELVGSDLYVLCNGAPSYAAIETAGKLVKINLMDNSIDTKVFPGTVHPSNLDFEANYFYYTINSNVYKMGVTDANLPINAFFTTSNQGTFSIYSFTVNNDKFYLGDAKNFNSNGEIFAYNSSGAFLNSFLVGVTPTAIYFNN